MRVVQVCIGKFHHFHLARHLHATGDLAAVYCGYPWSHLQQEGVPREWVRTFPWLQAPYMAMSRYGVLRSTPRLRREWEWRAQESLDRYAARSLPECDVVVGLSGSALRTGRTAQTRGARYVCDRGSSHIRYQDALLGEEHDRWEVPWRGIDPRIIEKEEAEYRAADLITVPSEFVRQSFINQGVPAERVAKVPYGANVQRFSPQGAPAPDRFVVLFVGQISLRKGVPYLLKAFADFKHPRKELWIVGGVTQEVETMLDEHRSDQIRLLGRVPNAELPSLYSRANAFVLPSIEEGLAMVQGEALACGCPVIATENTGAADLFDDGVEGFIVPIRNPEAIAARLTQLADESGLRERMSEAALVRVQRINGWEQYGEGYRRTLQVLCGSADIAEMRLEAAASSSRDL